jgi:Bacterial Ig domain
VFKGQTGAAVGLSTGSEHRAPEIMDFVESQLSGTQFSMQSLLSGTRIRVQNGGSAFQLDAAGNRTTISPFVTVQGGCQPGPTTPPGLPGAPSPNPPPTPGPDPGPTTTQPGPSPTSTTRPPPQPTPTTAPPTTQPPGTTQPPPAPPPPPTVQPRITAPASGATVSGIAMVTVTADGISGIRRVDLYVDGVREQADYRGPFLFAWPAFTLPPGTHTLRAILIRSNGSSLRSAPVTVETTGR